MGVLRLLASDRSTLLFDFTAPAGTGNPSDLITKLAAAVDFGTVDQSLDLDGRTYGAVMRAQALPPVEMRIPFMSSAATDTAHFAGLGQLGRSLLLVSRNNPAYLEWTELADTHYYEVIGALELPQLLRGQAQAGIIAARVSSLGPITLRLLRQPWMERAALDPASNKYTNASMLADSNRDGTPDGWTTAAGTNTIQASVEAFQVSHNAAATLLTRDFSAAAGTQCALSVEARKVSGDRTVEVRMLSQVGGTVLATATVTATTFTRYTLAGTIAGGDTAVRMEIRYTGGSTTTVSQFRDAQLETGTLVATAYRAGTDVISNDPAATVGPRTAVINNPGDLPAPVKLTLQAEAGSPRIGAALVGIRSSDGVVGHRSLTDFLNETRFAQCDTSGNGWTRTLGTDTTSTADAASSGGNAAEDTFATDATVMKRAVRLTRTTLLESVRGYHDVWVRLKPSAAMKAVVQLRWAPSAADPASYSEPEVTLDWSDATSFSYVDVPLGTIYLPEDTTVPLAGLALEVWARRDTGSGNCRFDFVHLFGSDPDLEDFLTLVQVPGGSRESWLGKDLVAPTSPGGLSAGAAINNRYRLNSDNEGGGTPTASGIVWGTGRHRVTFRIDGNGSFDFTVSVRNVTDGTNAATRAFLARKPSKVGEVVLKFDGVAAKAYQPQVFIPGSGGMTSGEYLDIKRIIHEVQPFVGSSEKMATDPDRALMYKQDSSGNLLSYLGAAGGVPLWAPPGRSVLEVVPIDIEVQSGATHGESVLARTLTTSGKLAPRYNG